MPRFESMNWWRKSKLSLELPDPLLGTAAGIALQLASSVCLSVCKAVLLVEPTHEQ